MALPFAIEAGTLCQAAALAAEEPPRPFAAFGLTKVDPPPGPRIESIVYLAVRCRSCGEDEFHVGSFATVAPDPSPNPNVAPGETLMCPPFRLRCASCGAENALFDPRTDGYDGVLCGGSAHLQGESEIFTDGTFKIHVAPTFGIGMPELQELAARAGGGVKPTDLFDWINIIGTPAGDDKFFEYDYECA
jgi:hypothetical protein